MAVATAESRRVAGIMRIVSFPIVLALLVIAFKLVAMAIVAALALGAYTDGDYEQSADYASWNLTANLIEPHKAHFDLGTAYLGSGLNQEARDELEEALTTAPLPDACAVRVNLSYAIEGLGESANAAGDFQAAADLYLEAADVLAKSDESCADSSERQDELTQKAQDAQNKADSGNDPQGGQGGQAPSDDPGAGAEGDSPIDSLQDLLDAAEQNKQENDAADRAYDNLEDLVEKPW
jgi:tetratricopeptide (TPR) repeat protein